MKRFTKRERGLGRDARKILDAALAAAHAGNAVRRYLRLARNTLVAGAVKLDLRAFDRIVVVSAGKAAVAMASAIEDILGPKITREFVVTKHGHAAEHCLLPLAEIWETGHPVPDETGRQASVSLEYLLRDLNARDLLIVALSGGASALLPAPPTGISLEDKGATTNLLLRAGAKIEDLNCVRKHLSLLKGGNLAALAYPAIVLGLLLSDVIGDRLDVIGSGPTAPDPTTYGDALQVLQKFGVVSGTPRSVRRYLERGAAGELPETPKTGDRVFRNVKNVLVGSGRLALEAAAHQAKQLGYRTMILSSTIDGETREAAMVHAEILREASVWADPVRPPACILSAGETTVTLKGNGRGGRNQEFVLAGALKLAGLARVVMLSAGTDGTDGPTDAAGAIADGSTFARALALDLNPQAHLDRNDSYALFDALHDLIRTGPTGTNVMDIHIMLAR